MRTRLKRELASKSSELEQKNEALLRVERDKLAAQNEELLQREKELLAKYFTAEKEALVRNHQAQVTSVKSFMNKEMSLKLEVKQKEATELRRDLEQKKKEVREIRERNRQLEQQYKAQCDSQVEHMRSRLEGQTRSQLKRRLSELEREFEKKREQLEEQKEQENQQKIDLVINRFSDEILEKDRRIETLAQKCAGLEAKLGDLEMIVEQAGRSKEVDILKGQVSQLRRDLSLARDKEGRLDAQLASAARENQFLSERLASIKVTVSQLEMQRTGKHRGLIEELEKSRGESDAEKKRLTTRIGKLKENMEIEVLNERNRMQAAYERQFREQDEKYKGQLKTIEGKIMSLLETKAKEMEELKEQVQAKDRLARKYEELLEKQRKDFLIKS